MAELLKDCAKRFIEAYYLNSNELVQAEKFQTPFLAPDIEIISMDKALSLEEGIEKMSQWKQSFSINEIIHHQLVSSEERSGAVIAHFSIKGRIKKDKLTSEYREDLQDEYDVECLGIVQFRDERIATYRVHQDNLWHLFGVGEPEFEGPVVWCEEESGPVTLESRKGEFAALGSFASQSVEFLRTALLSHEGQKHIGVYDCLKWASPDCRTNITSSKSPLSLSSAVSRIKHWNKFAPISEVVFRQIIVEDDCVALLFTLNGTTHSWATFPHTHECIGGRSYQLTSIAMIHWHNGKIAKIVSRFSNLRQVFALPAPNGRPFASELYHENIEENSQSAQSKLRHPKLHEDAIGGIEALLQQVEGW